MSVSVSMYLCLFLCLSVSVFESITMQLVNAVADHVHTSTADHYGAPNKNIGDAFLLVWKPKGQVCGRTCACVSVCAFLLVWKPKGQVCGRTYACVSVCAFLLVWKLKNRVPHCRCCVFVRARVRV